MAKLTNTQKVAADGLAHLVNNLVFAKMAYTDMSSYFRAKSEKIGTSILVRTPPKYTSVLGKTATPQEIEEGEVQLTLIRRNVAVRVDVEDENFRIEDFSYSVIKPAMQELAQQVDADGLALAKLVANTVGSITKGVTKASIINAKTKLDNEAAPQTQRCLFLSSETEASVVNSTSAIFNPAKEVSDQYRTRNLGGQYGFENQGFSQNVYSHTIGTAVEDPVLVDGAGQTGDILIVDGMVGDLNPGDTFTIPGVKAVNPVSGAVLSYDREFVVLTGSTKTSLKIFPAIIASGKDKTVSALPADNAALAFIGKGHSGEIIKYNLAFHKSAVVFANPPTYLRNPKINSYTQTDDQLGMSIRISQDYEFTEDEERLRFDIFYGWLLARPNLCVKIIDQGALLEEE